MVFLTFPFYIVKQILEVKNPVDIFVNFAMCLHNNTAKFHLIARVKAVARSFEVTISGIGYNYNELKILIANLIFKFVLLT